MVVEQEVLILPSGVADLSAAPGRDERIRVVERVPTKLVIAERAPAMVPLTGGGRSLRPWWCTRAGSWRP